MSENNKPALSEQEKKRINILAMAVIICSVAAVALVILKFAKVISVDAYMPVMAVTLLLQSCMFWKSQRKLGIFMLCTGLFCLLAFCVTTLIYCNFGGNI